MTTEKQYEANRNNAKLSTGPKTPEGKANVRMNALKHGLCAEEFQLLPTEKAEEFAARLDGWNRYYSPANPVEADLVHKAVVLSWLVDRALHYEGSYLSERVMGAIETCEREGLDLPATIRAADMASYDSSPEGDKRRRYQFALRRDLHRTLGELSKLPDRPPQPVDGMPGANEKAAAVVVDRGNSNPDIARHHSPEPEKAPVSPMPPAPNKANSPAPAKANSPAPAKVDFEEILREIRTLDRPNKANSPSVAPTSSGIGTKRSLKRRPNLELIHDARSSWLDISCHKP